MLTPCFKQLVKKIGGPREGGADAEGEGGGVASRRMKRDAKKHGEM